MAKSCANHSNQPSVTSCNQCQKALCKSCTMVTSHGSFCSSECSVIFREFKEKLKTGKKKSGAGAKAFLVLLLLAGAVVLIHLGARNDVEALKKVDVIGHLLENVKQSSK